MNNPLSETEFDAIHGTIPGWFDFADIYTEAVKSIHNRRSIFVEVGCFHGRSTAYMGRLIATSGKPIKFYAVDTFAGSPNERYGGWLAFNNPDCNHNQFVENINRCGVSAFVRPVVATSVNASKMFEDGSVDFVFIDASHEYADVKEDILAWMPKVKKGGVIAGHDYADKGTGVKRAVDELFPAGAVMTPGTSWLVALPV